jgi:hypothetical protein
VRLTEEQFQAEMAARRALRKDRNEYDIACPLCWAPTLPAVATDEGDAQAQAALRQDQ